MGCTESHECGATVEESKNTSTGQALQAEEECQELLKALSLKNSVDGGNKGDAKKSITHDQIPLSKTDEKEVARLESKIPYLESRGNKEGLESIKKQIDAIWAKTLWDSLYASPVPLPKSTNEQPTLETVARLINCGKCQNIIVLSGAGVSCAAGIPDFRTPGTGLYDNLEKFGLPYPEAVFDLSFYRTNPQPFVSLASELWPGIKHSPTISHSFVALLESKDLLRRNYTQNIDGLETLAGVSEDKLVECHGHFRTASCTECGIPYDGKECKAKIVNEQIAPLCYECGCLVKPDIVFFGESLPDRFADVLTDDMNNADLLIVMGTSLNVAPVSLIPDFVGTECPRVLINRELVGNFVLPGEDDKSRDIFEKGNCDDGVLKLCKLLGWEEELMNLHASRKLCVD